MLKEISYAINTDPVTCGIIKSITVGGQNQLDNLIGKHFVLAITEVNSGANGFVRGLLSEPIEGSESCKVVLSDGVLGEQPIEVIIRSHHIKILAEVAEAPVAEVAAPVTPSSLSS